MEDKLTRKEGRELQKELNKVVEKHGFLRVYTAKQMIDCYNKVISKRNINQ